METDVAQPAVGAACVAMLGLLRKLGCEPDVLGGHSYGELVALHAAGVLSAAALAELSQARGRLMREAGRGARRLDGGPSGRSGRGRTTHPRRSRRAGRQLEWPQADGDRRSERGRQAGTRPGRGPRNTRAGSYRSHRHSTPRWSLPLANRWLAWQASCSASHPTGRSIPISTRPPTPPTPRRSPARLGDHLAGPVRFAEMIEAMHRDGARVFVEVGPGSILTPLIDAILKDRAHLAVSCDAPGSSGLAGWLRAIARLVAAGLPLQLESLTRGPAAARTRSGASAGR